MDIYSFEVKGHQVDMTFKKGFIACSFEINGKGYGQKMKLPSRGVMDIVSVASLLVINTLESIEALKNESIS